MNPVHRILRAAIATGALLSCIPHLRAISTDEEIKALREQIATLDQKLRVLERKQEIKDEAAAADAKKAPVVAAGAGGFSISSADKKYQLRLRANIQADARFFLGDSVVGNDTFLLRRVRPILEGTVAEKFSFRIMPDFAPSTPQLLDAYAAYQFSPAFGILAGKAKSPFDLERLVSQTDLLFLERGFPTILAPNRDVGVQFSGDVLAGGWLNYRIGLLNGARDNDSSVTDVDDGKELVVRLFAHPFKNDEDSVLRGLGIGIAGSTGEKTAGSPNGFRSDGQQSVFAWRSTVRNNGTHTRIEPQGYFYRGPFGLIGSWISSKQELTTGTVSDTLDNRAWYVAGSWVVTGEDASYRGITPSSEFNWSEGTWGAFEVALRLSQITADEDVFPAFADPATSVSEISAATLGLNWYLNRNVKVSANFSLAQFEGGASNPIAAEDERALSSRVQLRF